jgi:outer membrane protein OmpA-like peptidoglycan-associated protein
MIKTINSCKGIILPLLLLCILCAPTSCRSKRKIVEATPIAIPDTNAAKIAALQSENAALRGKLEQEIAQNKILLEEKIKLRTIDNSSKERSAIYFDSIVAATNKDFDAVANAQQKAEQLALAQKLNVNIKRNYDDVKIISDILTLNTYVRFKAGAIFGPGKYVIDDAVWRSAYNTFTPVIDSIVSFTKKHPDKKFKASIAILGYSDASPIKNAALRNDLITRMSKPDATSADLNLQLSQLRAEAVAKVFDEVSVQKLCKSGYFNNIDLSIYPIGRGEELADPSLANSPLGDERRRAVIVYWSLIPQ